MYKPKHWHELTPSQKGAVLESHVSQGERSSKIKGCTVAGGNKQGDNISKEYTSSPTESVLLTCIVDAEEGRDIAVIDIPNAFIQMHFKEEKDMVTTKIHGVLVDILLEIVPEVYMPYVYTGKYGVKQ